MMKTLSKLHKQRTWKNATNIIKAFKQLEIITFVPNEGAQAKVWDIIHSPNEIECIWYRGGLNSGKSFIGAAFCVYLSQIDPSARGLITANTYGQLETSTLVALVEFCKFHNVPLRVEADGQIINGNHTNEIAKSIARRKACYIGEKQTFFYCLSAEIFTGKTQGSKESGRGLQVRRVWADEFAYAERSAFEAILGRLGRGSGAVSGMFLLTSSINRNNPYNWTYELFDNPDRTTGDRYISIVGSTEENKHGDINQYIARMKATLTPELFKIEINAEYAQVNYERIAYHFSREEHLISKSLSYYEIDKNLELPIHLSFDFNRSPACAIAGIFVKRELIIINEWYLVKKNGTFDLADSVVNWLTDTGYINRHLYIHGDASGNNQSANSNLTNWQIVINAIRRYTDNYTIAFKKSNPDVQDTCNTLNGEFYHNRLFINLECKELIKDLESVKWLPNGKEIDKKDPMRTHLFDCMRYLSWDLVGTLL